MAVRKNPEILYTTGAVNDAIGKVLSGPVPGERRVVLVAYVGAHAKSYLPEPDGLELICCLQPGATSAAALEDFRSRGAVIRKSIRLHMKVYWSSRKGCVITSANASRNALGKKPTKEAGAFFPPGIVDIEKFIEQANPSDIRDKDLVDLKRKSDLLPRGLTGSGQPSEPEPNYLTWYRKRATEPFKLGWEVDEDDGPSQAARDASMKYNRPEPEDYLTFAPDNVEKGDWLLCFPLSRPKNARWLFVQATVKVSRSDTKVYNRKFPFQAIQIVPSRDCRTPPFKLDKAFREAFERAVKSDTEIKTRASLEPQKALLDDIYARLKRGK